MTPIKQLKGVYGMNMAEKLKLMRKSEMLTQKQLSDLVGIPTGSLIHYEQGKSKPGADALIKLLTPKRFRKYRDWFMFDEVNLREGQDVPALAKAWERDNLINNSDKTA